MIGGLPRFPLALLPTPLHRAHRLEKALGAGPLLLKRDDLIGFGIAGNKARPLEFIVGAALAEGADVIVTGGGPGSHFCAAAAMAARAAGLGCELVVSGDPRGAATVALAVAAGATVVPAGGAAREAVDALVEERAAALRAAGRRPYAVPRGGSTALGAVGFAAAAAELAAQLAPLPEPPALVVLAVGSGGSCAGLVAGLAATGPALPVLGVSVSRPPSAIAARVTELAEGCAVLIRGPRPRRPELIDARGPGFGSATPCERERARLALHTEGLLLDETYGAEAFSAAVDRLLAGPGGPVVYWHTGGLLSAASRLAKGAA